jgi:hypothetical protein
VDYGTRSSSVPPVISLATTAASVIITARALGGIDEDTPVEMAMEPATAG